MGICARCLDVILMFLLFTPFIALYKKTGNELVEKVVLNDNPLVGPFILVATGIFIKVSLLTLRHVLMATILAGDGLISTMGYYTVTYLIGISTVCHIRGLTELYGMYMGGSLFAAVRALTTLTIILIAMKATKNLVSVPLVLKNDTPNNQALRVGTFLGTPGGFVDAFITVAVVHTLAHTWWAAWHSFLAALGFSPLTYLLVGLTICFWIVMLNEAFKATSRGLENKEFDLPRIAFEDLYHLFAAGSLIMGRRGISWIVKSVRGMFGRFLPGFLMGTIPLHLLAFSTLCFIGISLSLGGMSGGMDGVQGGGNDIVCKVKYFDLDPPPEEGEVPVDVPMAGQEKKIN